MEMYNNWIANTGYPAHSTGLSLVLCNLCCFLASPRAIISVTTCRIEYETRVRVSNTRQICDAKIIFHVSLSFFSFSLSPSLSFSFLFFHHFPFLHLHFFAVVDSFIAFLARKKAASRRKVCGFAGGKLTLLDVGERKEGKRVDRWRVQRGN